MQVKINKQEIKVLEGSLALKEMI